VGRPLDEDGSRRVPLVAAMIGTPVDHDGDCSARRHPSRGGAGATVAAQRDQPRAAMQTSFSSTLAPRLADIHDS